MSTRGAYAQPTPHVERATAVTDSNGVATFNWPAGAFSAAPVVTLSLEAGAGFRSSRISANTATQTQVTVLASAGVTVLGIGVLAAGTPAPGVTVHAHAVAP
ncbi:hypothetical protein AB0N14_18015 [Streptomyces sp. NPDC051104]|uniref:hypothetical protein n=1 Tax=Streptomyces sp. NPDC051104 TaxID=3155044 RepID=UPI0034130684